VNCNQQKSRLQPFIPVNFNCVHQSSGAGEVHAKDIRRRGRYNTTESYSELPFGKMRACGDVGVAMGKMQDTNAGLKVLVGG